MIKLDRKHLHDLDAALSREWLETNGLGGYASSTVLGINTRKYHGLLVAAMRPPVDRLLLVSRVDEALVVGEARFELAGSEYEDTIFPDGFRYIDEVRLDPFPVFTYTVGGVKLEKSIFMVYGENTTVVTYSMETLPNGPRRSQVKLEVRPLLAFRSHHLLMKENRDFDRTVESSPGRVRMAPYRHMPTLHLTFTPGKYEPSGYWYRQYHYRREKEQGYSYNEDLYSPGTVTFSFTDGNTHCLAFSTREATAAGPDLEKTERARRARIQAGMLGEPPARSKAGRDAASASAGGLEPPGAATLDARTRKRLAAIAEHQLGRQLLAAADAFVVKRGEDGRTVIAGYPWFSDWGRDTMISLPGLMLVTGRYDDARLVLKTYAASMSHGLLPNLFPDFAEKAEYNTIDATLWFFEAVRKYYDATGDADLVAAIMPNLRDAMRAHIDGTLYGIKVDEDGLLRGGVPGVQLTWMDAKVGNKVVTARIGKAVEINALWYNALRIMVEFCPDFGGLAEERTYDEMATKAYETFNRQFWDFSRDCLYDYLDGAYKDQSLRPNQVIAISLSHPVLEASHWKPVLEVVGRELATAYGLRTLTPNDPRYKGVYCGDLEARDHAYHQGTVWAWLVGPYLTAYFRAYGHTKETIAYASKILEAFASHLSEAGLGQVSEIFDGDPPYKPRGCIAQAWSVAEILRIIAEEIVRDASDDPGARTRKKAKRPRAASAR
ncbi:MAG TPA: amylo-alpha-1,6-glucosidase [bacterium]|nr:amylo-alpha-1,6-glucosidase [bacterium]